MMQWKVAKNAASHPARSISRKLFRYYPNWAKISFTLVRARQTLSSDAP